MFYLIYSIYLIFVNNVTFRDSAKWKGGGGGFFGTDGTRRGGRLFGTEDMTLVNNF